MRKFTILIHGGAGTILKSDMTPMGTREGEIAIYSGNFLTYNFYL